MHKISFLVLDYKKAKETKLCLESIRQNARFSHQIILMDNGSGEDYSNDFYEQGLCDILISRKTNHGGGYGQTDLFKICDTKYAFFVQCDQYLAYPIEEQFLKQVIAKLEYENFKCADFNGDQSNKGEWTDRAHLIDVEFFNSLAPFPGGGPGPFNHLRHNENYLQQVFKDNDYKILHITPRIFADNGVFTIREVAGGIVKMRTDTKEMVWLKKPTEKYSFPHLTDEEWELSIAGNWPDKKIPQIHIEKKESFNCWGNQSW